MEALDGKKNSNMLIAHPTGTGKSLPMLLLGLFLPEGIFLELLQSEEIISHELFRLDHVDSTSSNHDRGPAAE